MDFVKAVKLAKANEHLIGKVVKGATIDEIIIMPTNEKEQEAYRLSFAQHLDAQRAITPFKSSDVEVFALFNKRMIRSMHFFVTCKIVNLPKETGVITELLILQTYNIFFNSLISVKAQCFIELR